MENKREELAKELRDLHEISGYPFHIEDSFAIADFILSREKSIQAKLERARVALAEITEGKGRFSLDNYEHARNTIEDMKELAQEALKSISGVEGGGKDGSL